jgi:aminoglycoside phosphotransferase family enzyme
MMCVLTLIPMTPPAPTLPPGLDLALRQLASATHAGGAGIETVETHMSWVFLVGDQVLKLKKAVRYPFLDFSTPAARRAACREEVRLNSRLAPGVYRGLLALQRRAGQLELVPEADADPQAQTIDWLVQMRRLPQARMLDQVIAGGGPSPAEVDALADVLAAFYRDATVIDLEPAEYVARFQREQAASREVLLRPQFRIDGAEQALDRLDAVLRDRPDALRQRAIERRIVDGHGDLRPEHACLAVPPVVIDCLEFNARLRQVDPLDELAFLALECELAGASWVGARMIDRCAAALRDPAPADVLQLYTAYRALLRSRLAMAHLLDPQPRTPQRWAPLAQRYVQCALQALDRAQCPAGGPMYPRPATERGNP